MTAPTAHSAERKIKSMQFTNPHEVHDAPPAPDEVLLHGRTGLAIGPQTIKRAEACPALVKVSDDEAELARETAARQEELRQRRAAALEIQTTHSNNVSAHKGWGQRVADITHAISACEGRIAEYEAHFSANPTASLQDVFSDAVRQEWALPRLKKFLVESKKSLAAAEKELTTYAAKHNITLT
jgi:hypothetical protein